jgi:hypothetical protein
MNDRQREQIGRIISLASNGSRTVLGMALQRVYTDHAKAGRLDSGATILVAISEVERATDLLLSELVSKVAAVSRTPAAFAEVESGMRRWLRDCDDELKEIVRTASGIRLQDKSSTAFGLGKERLQKVKDTVEQRLEVERYDFEQAGQPLSFERESPKRLGGRPPAEFWDDLWAYIGASLYNGDLSPKNQADIEKAMAEWIDAQGHSAATSTVRSRARRLWDRLAALDS